MTVFWLLARTQKTAKKGEVRCTKVRHAHLLKSKTSGPTPFPVAPPNSGRPLQKRYVLGAPPHSLDFQPKSLRLAFVVYNYTHISQRTASDDFPHVPFSFHLSRSIQILSALADSLGDLVLRFYPKNEAA